MTVQHLHGADSQENPGSPGEPAAAEVTLGFETGKRLGDELKKQLLSASAKPMSRSNEEDERRRGEACDFSFHGSLPVEAAPNA